MSVFIREQIDTDVEDLFYGGNHELSVAPTVVYGGSHGVFTFDPPTYPTLPGGNWTFHVSDCSV